MQRQIPAEKLEKMTGMSNENYDVVSVLYHALKGGAACAEYLEDAREAKDQELVAFFERVLEEDRKCAEQAKEILLKRQRSPTEEPAQEEAVTTRGRFARIRGVFSSARARSTAPRP
jgi:hypothetical protein